MWYEQNEYFYQLIYLMLLLMFTYYYNISLKVFVKDKEHALL